MYSTISGIPRLCPDQGHGKVVMQPKVALASIFREVLWWLEVAARRVFAAWPCLAAQLSRRVPRSQPSQLRGHRCGISDTPIPYADPQLPTARMLRAGPQDTRNRATISRIVDCQAVRSPAPGRHPLPGHRRGPGPAVHQQPTTAR
jgi:hypothetical protein